MIKVILHKEIDDYIGYGSVERTIVDEILPMDPQYLATHVLLTVDEWEVLSGGDSASD